MKAVIFDLDGTLFNCEHRLHHLEGEQKDWDSFFGEMHLDTVIEPVAMLARLVHESDCAVLFVTARPNEHDYENVTADICAANNLFYTRLYMRRGGDFRRDDLVKADILKQILDDGFEPILAIDDKSNITEMWRSFGIVALQCASDESRKSRYAGQTLLHMLVGPSGSGKSSYCAKKYKPADIVSSDEVRKQLFGGHESGQGHNPEELARTWRYIHGLIKVRMENGLFTVLDATNLKPKDRKSVLAQVPEGIVVQYTVIDRDYDDKIRDRGWRPVELIDKHHRQMKSNIKGILDADNLGNVIVVDARS
jgi:predicted kinase